MTTSPAVVLTVDDRFARASERTGPTDADWLCVVEPWPGLPSDPDARTRRIQRGEWVAA